MRLRPFDSESNFNDVYSTFKEHRVSRFEAQSGWSPTVVVPGRRGAHAEHEASIELVPGAQQVNLLFSADGIQVTLVRRELLNHREIFAISRQPRKQLVFGVKSQKL
jgi:hypothetical protein